MKLKGKKILIPILSVVLSVFVFFLGFFTRELTYSPNQRAVLSILDKYEKYYYFESDNVVDQISDAIFDKYSSYMTKEEYQKVTSEASGKNKGIGVSFNLGSLKIVSVITNSPCDKAGVKVGGEIVKISVDGQDKPFSKYEEFLNIIDGVTLNQNLILTVDYDGVEKSYALKKSEYMRSYVTYRDSTGTYNFIDDGGMKLTLRNLDNLTVSKTAYIKYEQFSGRLGGNDGSVGQLKTALQKFKQSSYKNLILDLRNNGGGYMDILSEVAGLFVQKSGDKQVVSVAKDKNNKIENFYVKNNAYSSYAFDNIIVLANQNTASASEVLIGAMLDYDTENKVTVVLDGHEENGQTVYRTFGKGIMQTTYQNLNGSAVKLTTAEIFWPKSNISINGIGVTTQTSNKVKNAVNGNAYEYAINLLNN